MAIKVGIIGCGGIANQKHFPALKALGNRVEIVAFCDIIKERAEKAAAEFGTPDAKVFTDYRDLVAIPEIESVHVLTPNVSHCELTVAALDAGKNVLCEKPMAATPADAQKMLDAQKRSGKILTIGYQNRCRQDSLTLKAICEAVSIPVIAIGGISRNNVMELAGSGICGIAVISAIFAQPDIEAATKELRTLTEEMVES